MMTRMKKGKIVPLRPTEPFTKEAKERWSGIPKSAQDLVLAVLHVGHEILGQDIDNFHELGNPVCKSGAGSYEKTLTPIGWTDKLLIIANMYLILEATGL